MISLIIHFKKIWLLSLTVIMLFTGCLANEPGNLSNGLKLFNFNRKVEGSGHVIKEERALSNISEVILSEQGDLFIEKGKHERIIIEADENLLDYLFADVNNDTLEIYKLPENVTLEPTRPIKYHLYVTNLESLISKNSGDVEIKEITGESFSMQITGSGSVFIQDLLVNRFDAKLTSSGDLAVEIGIVNSQTIHLSSSGEYEGRNLESQNAIVEVSSSGTATVNVKESLSVDISSSGDVLYIGNPIIKIQNISSTGKLRKET